MNPKNQKKLTDEQLALQLQNGNNTAMGELYLRYYMLVFNKCLSFTKNTDDASDLTQEIMIRVMERISSFKGKAKFSTWLYAVSFNYCTDIKRKNKDSRLTNTNEFQDMEDQSELELEKALENELRANKINSALATISKEDQQLLLMKYQLNKSLIELQIIYNLSSSAMKMRLMRARSKALDSYNNMTTY